MKPKKIKPSKVKDVVLAAVVACAVVVLGFSQAVRAEASGEVELKKSEVPQFEIVDGNSEVTGEPGGGTKGARENWSKACEDWKRETKDLNKKNEVLGLSCSSPSCTYQENGSYICTSNATYKLKIAGVRAPPAPAPTPLPVQMVVQEPPPRTIVEIRPDPLPGYLWAAGFWGWHGHRHIWYPGHWMRERPGHVWVGHQWVNRGHGWSLRMGHWED